MSAARPECWAGSPPRAWGRLSVPRDGQARVRFTPTCVWTTSASKARSVALSVHPHVRGDDAHEGRDELLDRGSPPRAWGRFTPTCVGTTRASGTAGATSSVHPHVRGDDVWRRLSEQAVAGSPPRAWGRRRRRAGPLDHRRFTPTCVGTTSKSARRRLDVAVHPHVRGDDVQIWGALTLPSGSPPRAWGRHALKSYSHTSPSVHPHVRGDDALREMAPYLDGGSPPRAWGRRRRVDRAGPRHRFTPTCVGTTASIARTGEG